jgi:hypothetical protein
MKRVGDHVRHNKNGIQYNKIKYVYKRKRKIIGKRQTEMHERTILPGMYSKEGDLFVGTLIKKEEKKFLIYQEIQKGSVTKSYTL